MTDNERIEWLNKIADKTKNTIHSNCDVHLFIDDFIATVDLINRQKAENERLNRECNKQQLKRQMYRSTVEEIKSEAIKEFAERLKEKRDGGTYPYVLVNVIDNIVKEMVGKSFTKIEHNSLCETETYKGGE